MIESLVQSIDIKVIKHLEPTKPMACCLGVGYGITQEIISRDGVKLRDMYIYPAYFPCFVTSVQIWTPRYGGHSGYCCSELSTSVRKSHDAKPNCKFFNVT